MTLYSSDGFFSVMWKFFDVLFSLFSIWVQVIFTNIDVYHAQLNFFFCGNNEMITAI